jgi:hypothetical protein
MDWSAIGLSLRLSALAMLLLLIPGLPLSLARPRLRPARGIRQFDSAERGAAGFSGLATESLKGKAIARLTHIRRNKT